ncbi:ComF family protein [Spirosoma montaniterrae]|uniref:Phosphoribosyltransferase n=1 Tax=Spirosoma montaniterrae TaxID=1178516 RepID=A0A1P9X1F0_9BACT|nr:ComF family protein [Spirosoma montaniterrae]AQG81462.1 phosphoribosyltransferase [Spirosoma montaniterrae]
MFRFIYGLLNDFIDTLYPTLCLGCSRSLQPTERVLCAHCRIRLPETGQHRNPDLSVSINKFAGKVPVAFALSYLHFQKGGTVQKLIHKIKYGGQKEAAREVAGWYGYQLKQESIVSENFDLIIGVPLHRSRLNQRGYNQADWIAEGFAESLGIPARTDILIREQFKTSQTKKNRVERWENVKTVFAVTDPTAIAGKNIILIDDVLTTGATLGACATELLQKGCKSVGVITLAATQ